MRSKREKINWRSYLVFLLPFSGLAIVLIYLSVFSIYRHWDIVLPGLDSSSISKVFALQEQQPTDLPTVLLLPQQNPTDVRKFFLENLASLRNTLKIEALGADPVQKLANAITAKNAVVWGFANGLVAIALLFAIIISGYTIWHGPRRETDSETRRWTNRKRWLLTASLSLFSLVLYPLISHELNFFNNFTIVARQHWEVISSQFRGQESLFNFFNIEILVVALGYAVSLLLVWASASTLWPLREIEMPGKAWTLKEVNNAASHVSRQMKHLRLVLYIGAILLVLITFRHKTTMQWALEYMKPNPLLAEGAFKAASLLYGNLETLISNNLTGTSIFNTLLLAGVYVPSALVLQSRAAKLSQLAVQLEYERAWTAYKADEIPEPLPAPVFRAKQEKWIKSYGLIHPFKEQLPKVIAILSPLIAGPIGELLNFFK